MSKDSSVAHVAGRRWSGLFSLVAFLTTSLATGAATPGELASIQAAHARVRDLSLDVVREKVQERELKRMKRGASAILEFTKIKVYFKAPDRLRLEGRYGLVPVTMVENGNAKVYRLGLGVRHTRDLSEEPGKKQGGLEFGLLSGEIWEDYEVRIVNRERWQGDPTLVLEMKARADRDGSYHKVWVDADTLRVVRRDRVGADDTLKHRHVFREPYRSSAGTWLSRRIDVYNQYGRFTGTLALTDIEVNSGLAESLFRM